MLSVGLWRCYINITITFLYIIRRPVFYLKHNLSGTGFCLCLLVQPTQLGPIGKASLCLRIVDKIMHALDAFDGDPQLHS
jgi:hypothetical protein